jgi:type IV pilus assembly protein PilP
MPLLGLALVACTGGVDEELRSYTEEVLKRKAEPLPPPEPPKPYVVYTYQGKGPDPFEPFFMDAEEQPVADDSDSEFAPEEGHVQEELELFPLDALRMVGTLEQDEAIWGIVLDREGTVYRVKVGNYMGQNYGKIIAILEDRIELEERARDSNGKWFLREASLALAE